MQILTGRLGITVGRLDFRVLQDGVVGTGKVYLYQVLIHDTPGANVQMPRLRVTHLSVWQTNVPTRSL